MIDASKRKKKDHMPSGATYSRKGARGRIVDAKLLSDSVTAGKTGFSEATHLWNQLSSEARLKMDAILFDTTSSNTGKLHGLAAELERLAARDLMVIRCLLHVLSLLMVSFGTRLCGETPSLHTGSSTEPQAIALLLFLHYCENREWKDLKEAYFTLWKPHTSYAARVKPVFSRWKYVTKSSIQATKRWGKTVSMALLKTTQKRGPEFTGHEIPEVQPIARLGCSAARCAHGCQGTAIEVTQHLDKAVLATAVSSLGAAQAKLLAAELVAQTNLTEASLALASSPSGQSNGLMLLAQEDLNAAQ